VISCVVLPIHQLFIKTVLKLLKLIENAKNYYQKLRRKKIVDSLDNPCRRTTTTMATTARNYKGRS
jgi:hypothetical protein